MYIEVVVASAHQLRTEPKGEASPRLLSRKVLTTQVIDSLKSHCRADPAPVSSLSSRFVPYNEIFFSLFSSWVAVASTMVRRFKLAVLTCGPPVLNRSQHIQHAMQISHVVDIMNRLQSFQILACFECK